MNFNTALNNYASIFIKNYYYFFKIKAVVNLAVDLYSTREIFFTLGTGCLLPARRHFAFRTNQHVLKSIVNFNRAPNKKS